TRNGSLQFLQVVGATMDELEAAQAWRTDGVLSIARATNPLLLTNLQRRSILQDPAVQQAIAEGIRREGSSSGSLSVRELGFKEAENSIQGRAMMITIGASGVSSLRALLRGRIPFGRSFLLLGPDTVIAFEPARAVAWNIKDAGKEVVVQLPAEVTPILADA